MLAAHCPACDVTQLYSYARIHSLRNTPRGIQLVMRCYCGERFTVLTGRAASRALQPAASTA